MKIELNTNELKTVLKNLKGNISKYNTSLYISAKNNVVKIVTTDFKNLSQFETSDFTVFAEGDIVVNYETIVKLIDKFNSTSVVLNYDDNSLFIEYKDKKAKIGSEIYKENETINRLNEINNPENVANDFEVDSNVLNKYFDKAKKFTLKDDYKPIISTILLKQNNEGLDIVALDGFRICCFTTKDFYGDNVEIVINKEIFTEYLKLKVKNEKVNISYNDKLVMLQVGKYKFISEKVQGEFLKYENMFNTVPQISLSMDTNRFKKMSKLFTTKESKPKVKYTIDDSYLKIEQKTSDYELEDKIEIENISKNNLEIGFNPNFVSETLEMVDAGTINVNFEGNLSPMVLKSENEQFLILPIRL